MSLTIDRNHIFSRQVQVWTDVFPNKSLLLNEEMMNSCIMTDREQVKSLVSRPDKGGGNLVFIHHQKY